MASNVAMCPETAVRPEMAARPVPSKPADSGLRFWQVVFLTINLIIIVLVKLFTDKRSVRYMTQVFSQTLDAVAGALASGLNGLLEHVNHSLHAAGMQVGLPINTVTQDGVVLVAQWILLLLICYGVIAITFRLATFLLRWLWWLLKVGVALACFGLILEDHSVGIETTMRLVCLGTASLCILMRIKLWKDRTMAAKIVHLEEQLKILEHCGREMERWRRRFITLSCCFLCLVFFIVISNSKAS